MHLHLDLTGGLAGDMFVAAMLDTFPELQQPLQSMLQPLALENNFTVDIGRGTNKGIAGTKFKVHLSETSEKFKSSVHVVEPHPHYHWHDIREMLQQSPLSDEVKVIAIGIFNKLAKAEAHIHGVNVEDVAFHEVGAWDCIADIVSAAWLINTVNADSWSMSPIPIGGGSVQCAHGIIPIPAPATLELLKGFEVINDGDGGERVTPTGAAILAWLSPTQIMASGKIHACGYGLGTRLLRNRPNILRVTALTNSQRLKHEQIVAIQCDIDDMSGELLALARESLRSTNGVLEVSESVSHGKKHRFISTLTLLCQPSAVVDVVTAIFNQTSTLGVCYWFCERLSLKRELFEVDGYPVKVVRRPDGTLTAKIEADALLGYDSFSQRQQLKRTIEQQAEADDEHR
ncbi:LarC family nickel insertion protein [Shewanella sp.]|uniref:LarC family nickel insertion protein n=1 Tax=Shewanella sp. TaxID=50422 RepID=UPI003A97AFD9